uniref:SFRICE_034803 n=1 Tax=Spodoptera frugiperda TaxID=7108 RepID=A0A2H1WG12_SPOFR
MRAKCLARNEHRFPQAASLSAILHYDVKDTGTSRNLQSTKVVSLSLWLISGVNVKVQTIRRGYVNKMAACVCMSGCHVHEKCMFVNAPTTTQKKILVAAAAAAAAAEALGGGGRRAPPPLLRSRTLPAIIAPGFSILHAQIDPQRTNVKYLQFNSNIELRLRDEINDHAHSKCFPYTLRLQIHHISWQNLHRNCRIAAYLLPERVAIIPENVPS